MLEVELIVLIFLIFFFTVFLYIFFLQKWLLYKKYKKLSPWVRPYCLKSTFRILEFNFWKKFLILNCKISNVRTKVMEPKNNFFRNCEEKATFLRKISNFFLKSNQFFTMNV